jgi:hypothetical protein
VGKESHATNGCTKSTAPAGRCVTSSSTCSIETSVGSTNWSVKQRAGPYSPKPKGQRHPNIPGNRIDQEREKITIFTCKALCSRLIWLSIDTSVGSIGWSACGVAGPSPRWGARAGGRHPSGATWAGPTLELKSGPAELTSQVTSSPRGSRMHWQTSSRRRLSGSSFLPQQQGEVVLSEFRPDDLGRPLAWAHGLSDNSLLNAW